MDLRQGVGATTAVSLLIAPVSAKTELHADLVQVTNSFGDLLTGTTSAFLAGSEEELKLPSYSSAIDNYKKAITSMTKNLKEAKYEHYVLGTEREHHLEARIVNCMQRLSQSTGGLRSAATTQFLLLAQPAMTGDQSFYSGKNLRQRIPSFLSTSSGRNSPTESHAVLESIDETPEDSRSLETSDISQNRVLQHPFSEDTEHSSLPSLRSPSDMFTRFIMQLGPSMVHYSHL